MADGVVCWFCDYERERAARNRDAWMALLFAAAMPFDRMMQALCARHGAAFTHMYAQQAQVRSRFRVSGASAISASSNRTDP